MPVTRVSNRYAEVHVLTKVSAPARTVLMYVHSDLGYIIPVVTAFASEPRKQVHDITLAHRPKETKIILSCLKSLNKIIPLNP